MASTLDWKSSDDPRDIVHIVVQTLVEGHLAVLPAETAYHVFASALKPDAVARLLRLTESKMACRPTLFLRSPAEALDYSPALSRVAARVVNRGWPGPLVLELPVDAANSLVNRLPREVFEPLQLDGNFVPQRVAAHDAICHAMRLMPGPLVAAPLCTSDGSPVCVGKEVLPHCGSEISACVDDGTTHYGGLATSVRIDGNQCTVTAPGVLTGETLLRLGQFVVLMVCTGNTCRSPMAEAILREKLKKRFPEAFDNGTEPMFITSAGLSALPGGPASPEAVSVMKARGLSLHKHQSSSVTERSLHHADLVLTMTNSHRSAIVDRFPELSEKVHLMSGSSGDVSDPFGGSESVYSACADQIDGYLDRWIELFEETWFPKWSFDQAD